VENGFALEDELPLEDLQPVLELLNQLSALSQAVKEQRWQREALNSNCCASTLLRRGSAGGNGGRLFTSASTDNGVGDTSESSDSSPLASARYSGNLPGTTGSGSGGCPGDDQMVSNLGVELRLDQKMSSSPLTSNALPSSLVSHLTLSKSYLLQATLKALFTALPRGLTLVWLYKLYPL